MTSNLENARLMAEVDCEHCDGGQVASEDWQAFEEWRGRRPTLTVEDEDDLVERYFIEVCDYNAVPPMRTDCEHCAGAGTVSVKIDVRELLEVVFEHVDQPVIATAELDELVDHVKHSITAAALASQGLADGEGVGTWLRAVQEGAEALRSIGELRARQRDAV